MDPFLRLNRVDVEGKKTGKYEIYEGLLYFVNGKINGYV